MNFANLTPDDKDRVKKIFLYGVSVGKANNTITETQALRQLEEVLKTDFVEPDPDELYDSAMQSAGMP